MPSRQTSVDIAAPLATVWEVTLDVESWPSWSPTMDRVVRKGPGPIRPGAKVRVRQPRLPRATWVVDRVEPGRAFVWHSGGLGYRVTAEHLLEAHGSGTRVLLRAAVTGALAAGLWYHVGDTVERYLDEEAAALKRRCERR